MNTLTAQDAQFWRSLQAASADLEQIIAQRDQLRRALTELELYTRQFISGKLVTFPAALLPQCRTILEQTALAAVQDGGENSINEMREWLKASDAEPNLADEAYFDTASVEEIVRWYKLCHETSQT